MKKLFAASFALLLCSFSQEQPKPRYDTFFGCHHAGIVTLDVNQFIQMLNQPICAKDSSNNMFKVESYDITYAERGVYQDSTGLPIITVDYTSDHCKGDSVTTNWKQIFKERAFKGDTIYIEKVSIKDQANKYVYSKGVKIILKGGN